ncbi:hypothetical protein PAEPH01_0639 [Pancytospora epiphaga]|nr:hypothetical protein PAEPH01_0639 [Pancytospora epiphaga]
MSNFDKSFSYETLLENLRATHDTRKRRFEERKHLLSDEDRAIERTLFRLEDDAIARSEYIDEKDVLFNFDEFMNEISGGEPVDVTDSPQELEVPGYTVIQDRRHVCPRPGCNKSYTSSHGLKYHMTHGHSKDKENVYKPFVCTVGTCDKAYRNSNGLKYHMAKAHPNDK